MIHKGHWVSGVRKLNRHYQSDSGNAPQNPLNAYISLWDQQGGIYRPGSSPNFLFYVPNVTFLNGATDVPYFRQIGDLITWAENRGYDGLNLSFAVINSHGSGTVLDPYYYTGTPASFNCEGCLIGEYITSVIKWLRRTTIDFTGSQSIGCPQNRIYNDGAVIQEYWNAWDTTGKSFRYSCGTALGLWVQSNLTPAVIVPSYDAIGFASNPNNTAKAIDIDNPQSAVTLSPYDIQIVRWNGNTTDSCYNTSSYLTPRTHN